MIKIDAEYFLEPKGDLFILWHGNDCLYLDYPNAGLFVRSIPCQYGTHICNNTLTPEFRHKVNYIAKSLRND